jgi:hypothetical protein
MPRNLPARRLATLVEVTTRVIWHRLRVLPAATALAGIAAGVTIPLAAPGSTLTILVWWAIATGLLGAVESFVQASGVSGRLVAGVISVAFGLFVLGGPVQDLAVLVLSVTLRIEEALGVGPAALRPRGRADVDVEDLAAAERAHIVRVLESCDWAIQGHGRAAERLGLRPSTLRNRMRKLGIRRPTEC